MIIKLSQSYYELAKSVDFSVMQGHINFNDADNSIGLDEQEMQMTDFFGEEYKASPIDVMLGCISDEIVATGMTDNQETVLPRGRELYNLYDGIYYNL